MNAIIPRFSLSDSVGGPDRARLSRRFANAVFLSGDRGTAAVRGEDQRFDASRAAEGAGGHHRVSESSGGSRFLTTLNLSRGLTF